jgi:hypothetical protein
MVGEVDTQGMVGKQEGRTAATLVLASVRLAPVIDSGSKQSGYTTQPQNSSNSTYHMQFTTFILESSRIYTTATNV